MTSELPITERDGMFSFMLRSCTSHILAYILDTAIPFVWLRSHTPKRYIQWWPTRAPLSERCALHDVEVRSMEFDLQLSTTRFLELLPEFEDHGIVLFQMTRRVPDTLTLDGVAEGQLIGCASRMDYICAFICRTRASARSWNHHVARYWSERCRNRK